MGRRQKSPIKEKKHKTSGVGQYVTDLLLQEVLFNYKEVGTGEFTKILEDFEVAILNEYLKNNIDYYSKYSFEDMAKLNAEVTQKALSLLKREFPKYTGGNYE